MEKIERVAKRVQDLEVYKVAFQAAETQTWLEFSLHCRYITEIEYDKLNDRYEHIFAMLNNMEKKADAFCI